MSKKPTYEELENRILELEQILSERGRIEKEISENQARLQLLYDRAPIAYQSLDENGDIIEVNQAWLDILGYSRKEAIEKSFSEFLHPDWKEHFKENFHRFKAVGEVLGVEFEIIKKDGSSILISFNGKIGKDKDGGFHQTHCIFQDITDRKRAEEELIKSHEDTRRQSLTLATINRLFRESIVCESSIDVAKTCLVIAEEVTGSQYGSIEEVNSNNQFDTLALSIPGWEQCRMAELDPACAKNMEIRGIWGAALNSEHGLIINDPSRHPLSVGIPKGHPPLTSFMGMPFRHKNFYGLIGIANREGGYTETDREIIKALVFAFAEVINSKRAEEALRESEEKYRKLIELAQEGIWVIDKDSNTSFVNQSMAKMLKYAPDEMNGKHFFSFMDKQGVEIAEANLERRKQGIKVKHDFEFIRKDGQRIFATLEIAPILDEAGIYNGSIAGVIDITERKKAELEKEMLMDQLAQAQKMEAIGTLAGGIAHDFNNILSAIMGYSEISLANLEEDTKLYDNLQEVLRAGNRATKLVRHILTFSRQTEKGRKPVQVKLIVKEAYKFLRASLPTTIEVRQDIQSDSTILADPTHVHQILMNLCTNAGHAMLDRGGVLEIKLEDIELDAEFTASHPDMIPGIYLNLTVSDTGHGMPPQVLRRIFDPFFTTKKLGEGTGMGLSVTHGIVGSYRGTVTASSEPERGSTFKVYLPIIETLKEPVIKIKELIPTGSECILFIDDEPALAKLGKQILESLGYEVVIRTSSLKAFELFKVQPEKFDLIITDLTMPHMTGAELAKEMIRIRPKIPVILCTGYSAKINEQQAAAMGIEAFIIKPLGKRELAISIRKLLDQKEIIG